jgi:hypothetical protein
MGTTSSQQISQTHGKYKFTQISSQAKVPGSQVKQHTPETYLHYSAPLGSITGVEVQDALKEQIISFLLLLELLHVLLGLLH